MEYLPKCKDEYEKMKVLLDEYNHFLNDNYEPTQQEIVVENLLISFVDNFDEFIFLLTNERFTLYNDVCRKLLEIYLMTCTIISDSKFVNVFKNMDDSHSIKHRELGLEYYEGYPEKQQGIQKHIDELKLRINARGGEKYIGFPKMARHVKLYNSSPELTYSLYKQLSKDVHISILTEPLKRTNKRGKKQIKTIRANTSANTNSLQMYLVAKEMLREVSLFIGSSIRRI